MPGYKTVKAFNEDNTAVVRGYADSAEKAGSSERVEVEKVNNIYGSCAGAGSGEFDVYRAAKRREQLRLERLEKHDIEAAERAAFEAKIIGNKRQAEERTSKNAEKRKKKKLKKKEWKAKNTAGSADGHSGRSSDSEEADEEDDTTDKRGVAASVESVSVCGDASAAIER